MKKALSTGYAAKKAGISLVTLQRWIAAGRVKAPGLQIRRGRAVRLWSQADLTRLREVKKATYRRGRGRKRKRKLKG